MRSTTLILVSLAFGALAFGSTVATLPAQTPRGAKRSAHALASQWKAMRAKGYSMLLARIERAEDRAMYAAEADLGRRSTAPFLAPTKKYPAGYWVWRAPVWYVWRDYSPLPLRTAGGSRVTFRSPSPHSVPGLLGAPNGRVRGQLWVPPSKTRSEILLEFERVVAPRAIRIVTTTATARIAEIHLRGLDGRTTRVFRKTDASVMPLCWQLPLIHVPRVTGVVLVLEAGAVGCGLDAVALIDRGGREHWASAGHRERPANLAIA